MFIGREAELKRLEKMYSSNKLEFATVYGRRRVGKTTLINHFTAGRRCIFFACQKSSVNENLIELSAQVSADNNAISSIIQNILDHEAKESKLFLILSGSSISFMEDEVLGKESPLHGRITAQFLVKPFDYLDSGRFVPSYSCSDKAIVYGITGGIPRYLELFDDSVSLKENLLYNIFDSNSVLFNERENYLKEEFSEVSTYSSILNAIANGSTKIADIASLAGIQVGALPSYLNKLREVGVVDKLVPLGESEKKGVWRICDLFFRFHSFFVTRNISTIVSGRMPQAYDKVVAPLLNDYMGKVFEEIVRQYIERHADLPFPLGALLEHGGVVAGHYIRKLRLMLLQNQLSVMRRLSEVSNSGNE